MTSSNINGDITLSSVPSESYSLPEFFAKNLPGWASDTRIMTVTQSGPDFQARLAKEWKSDSSTSLCTSCHKPFHLFRRKHHCRFCGEVCCAKCTCFRVVWTNSSQPISNTKYSHRQVYRACELCFALFLNMPSENQREIDAALPVNIVPKRERSNTVIETLYTDHVMDGSHNQNSGQYNLGTMSSSVPNSTIVYCPICSKQFSSTEIRHDHDVSEIDRHVDACIKRSSQIGCIGDRYSSFTYHQQYIDISEAEEMECSICYEPFQNEQQIALLNCFCKYHEHCISTWFLKGKGCPFHPKRQMERYLQ